MSQDRSSNYKTVQGLTRGLYLLNILNRLDGGASVRQLSELSGIHRTTVKRILETLKSEGYVRYSDSDNSFRLTMKVRELSEGFRDEQWISAVAAPLLGGLLEKVVWPTDITTLDVDAMVIRETTHRYSRLSFHRAMVGRRLPILQTACGLTYLAFCPQNERSNILTILAERDEPEYQLAREPQELDKILQHIREKGYGENNQSWQQENKIAAIAVPIHDEDRLLGCLNLVYIAKAMSLDKAAENYLADLQDVAKQIESGVSENTIRFGYPIQQ